MTSEPCFSPTQRTLLCLSQARKGKGPVVGECAYLNDAAGLETALATAGPQSVTVAAMSWQLYGGGLFHGCSKGMFGEGDNTLDHGVQAVGYNADHGYWIVRNSWGTGWGQDGYIFVEEGSNSCGIAKDVTISKGATNATAF